MSLCCLNICKRTRTCHAIEMSSILKSESDYKTYRIIHLENGLKALLVSCPDEEDIRGSQASDGETETGGNDERENEDGDAMSDDQEEDEEEVMLDAVGIAALCVGIGSFSDPPDIPGLASLLEYTITEGSKKYPDENCLEYFTTRGGDANSFTEYERNIFLFSIGQEEFKKGLKRFAQSFIAPSLKKDSIDKALQELDSGFQTTWTCDDNRKAQLLSSMCVKDHPMGRLSYGNTESIKTRPEEKGINVHQRLREFRERNYSAQYMTLVVQSQEPLDVLQRWVTESFSDIPNNNLPKEKFEEYGPPFDPEKFNKLYKVVPVKDCEQIHLTWSLPPLLKHYKSNPVSYLTLLMGHEGQGSMKALLTRRSLALEVGALRSESNFEQNSTHTMVSLVVTLTETGCKRIEDVIAVIFQYIKMMQQVGPQERIFKEMQTVANNDFRFPEKEDSFQWIGTLAQNMQLYPDEHILSGHLLRYEYEPELYAECANYLTLDNANILLYSKRFVDECTSEEYWYKTKYTVEEIPAEWRRRVADLELNPDLHLPKPNKFIATNFDLKAADKEDTAYPEILVENPVSRYFYKRDKTYNSPRGYIYLQLWPPLSVDRRIPVLLDLMTLILEHKLSEVGYDAIVAGLKYAFKTDYNGLLIEVSGFSHKLLDLVKMLIDYLADFSVREDQFEILKQGLMSSYYNRTITKSDLKDEIMHALLEEKTHFPLDKAALLHEFDKDMVEMYASLFRRQLYIKGLVQGNFTSKETIDLEEYVRNRLACQRNKHLFSNRAMDVRVGHGIFRVKGLGPQDQNTIVSNYYQLNEPGSVKLYSKLIAIWVLMEGYCWEVLQTQEQIADEIKIKVESTYGILGLSVTVTTQATKFSAAHVNRRIDDFLRSFAGILSNMSAKTFKEKIRVAYHYKLCPHLNLAEEVDWNWSEVKLESFLFSQPFLEALELGRFTMDDIRQFWREYFADGNCWRKISVQIIGIGEAEPFNKPDPSNNEVDREKGRGVKSKKMSLEVVPLEEVDTGYVINDIDAFKQSNGTHPYRDLETE